MSDQPTSAASAPSPIAITAAAEPMLREEVPDELLQKALKLVQASVKGNGLRDLQVALNDFSGEILHFEAWEIFRMDPQVAEKRGPGKQPGEVVGSHSEMRSKISGLLQKITENPDVKKNTIEILKKRNDLGFALKNQSISLEKFNRGYVVHDLCSSCAGTKSLKCSTCHGDGRSPCPRCRGSMLTECPSCNGQGRNETASGTKQCSRCIGRGKVNCVTCKGKGVVSCLTCKGDGKISCQGCNATGWNSTSGFVNIHAKCSFGVDMFKKKPFFYPPPKKDGQLEGEPLAATKKGKKPVARKNTPVVDFFFPVMTEEEYNKQKHERIDKAELPEELPPLVEKYGPLMVMEKHGDIHYIKEDVRLKELDQESKPDEYKIPFHVRLPFGTIAFRIKDQIITGRLFGFNPRLLQMPPFLEEMLAEPRAALEQASRGKSRKNTLQILKKTSRYRAIGELLRAAALNGNKKALEHMMLIYPFGFQFKTMSNMVMHADMAIKNATGGQRHAGLFIGLALCAVFFGLWNVGPLRMMATANLPATLQVAAGLDLGLILSGGLICYALIKFSARSALRDAVGHLFSPKEQQKLIPKTGMDGIWGFLGAALLCVGTIEAGLVVSGNTYPLWYEALRELIGI